MTPAAVLALAMTCASTVHPDTVHDVAKTESGFNPFAIAEIIPKAQRVPGDKGVISYFPSSIESAMNIVSKIQSRGRRYSVGLMQITSTNFSTYGMTAEKLFDPCNNLMVFEKIITDCYTRGGSLLDALSCYYSGDFNVGKKAEKDFDGTSYVQRIGYNPPAGGYVVPGTKDDQQQRSADPEPDSAPPAFESWDILREYPRPTAPQKSQQDKKEDNSQSEVKNNSLAG